MNRSTRTLIVIVVALAFASGATYFVFTAIKNRPVREVEVARAFAVVAAHPLAVGSRLAAADVKLVPWPAANMVPGGFTAIDQVVDRGVITPVAENEPLNGNNLASKEAGAGLPPTIPPGMRAISVRVNEVIGVAGFVVPGTRVDVMVIVRNGADTMAKAIVNNVQVLAAGTKYDQDVAKEGKAIPSSVVTLMVTPEDAERIGLAAVEGQIMLTLRNPMDAAPAGTAGIRTQNLMGGAPVPAAPEEAPKKVVHRAPAVAPPPPPPPPPPVYTVETIRAAHRTQETIK